VGFNIVVIGHSEVKAERTSSSDGQSWPLWSLAYSCLFLGKSNQDLLSTWHRGPCHERLTSSGRVLRHWEQELHPDQQPASPSSGAKMHGPQALCPSTEPSRFPSSHPKSQGEVTCPGPHSSLLSTHGGLVSWFLPRVFSNTCKHLPRHKLVCQEMGTTEDI
jgi:hypothetical protein